ncbi:hypothetical protein HID58_046062, partial [Brassica napus]
CSTISTTVCLSVFDVQASKLHQNLDGVGVEPKARLAGRLYLNAISGTNFHFDKEVSASQSYFAA